jgi:hypothetical protein
VRRKKKQEGAGRPPRAGERMDDDVLKTRLSQREKRQLKAFCEREGTTKSDVVRRALASYGAITLDEE